MGLGLVKEKTYTSRIKAAQGPVYKYIYIEQYKINT